MEKDVGRVEKGLTYSLTNAVVREFQNTKYLSMPKDNAKLEIAADVDMIDTIKDADATDHEDESICTYEMSNAEVVAVEHFHAYKMCILCNNKVEQSPSVAKSLGRCTKCETLQRLDRCSERVAAKLLLTSEIDQENHVVTAFGDILRKITNEISEENLLTSTPFSCTISGSNVITSVHRHDSCLDPFTDS